MSSVATPIAIIGMSVRAAGVETLADLWDVVVAGRRRFVPVPADRWPGMDVPASPRAALMDGIDGFDARFFAIAPRTAAWMDPQHRMALELAWHAVEDAGIDPSSLEGVPVAVMAGAFLSEYRDRMTATTTTDSAAFAGTLMTFLANRISYQFGWTGPSAVIDSACSSGLTALDLAVQGLQAGRYPMALVAATNLTGAGFYPSTAYRSGALSRSGDSVPFSADRDGYVRGEGGACVLLKPLPVAIDDGDPIHAVIRAVHSAHTGRRGGLTATDSASIARLMRDTAAAAGCHVHDIGFLEAHGTATPSGDLAEITALTEALLGESGGLPDADGAPGADRLPDADRPWQPGLPPAGPGGKVWVGSIKANVGHLEAASGLIGLVKAVMVTRRGVIPRVAGLGEVDPRLVIHPTRVAVAVNNVGWPAGFGPRRVAVSAFGLGGAISHAIVEQASPARRSGRTGSGHYVVPLSAQSEAMLAVLAGRLLQHIEAEPSNAAESREAATPPEYLARLTWTMQNGRRAQRVRRAVVVRTLEELCAALRALADGPTGPPGDAGGDPGAGIGPDPAAGLSEPERTAVRRWLAGEAVDWRDLWDPRDRPAPVHAPGSPFDRRSYWFDDRVPSASGSVRQGGV